MKRRNYIILGIIGLIMVLAVIVLAVNPIFSGSWKRDGFKLGLDLKGGISLQYKVQFPQGVTPGSTEGNQLISSGISVIQSRIDKFGLTSPEVYKVGNDSIAIQLPGVSDTQAAIKLVQQVGFLEFREVEVNASGAAVTLNDYLTQSSLAFIDQAETGPRYFVSDTALPGTSPIPGYPLIAILQTNPDGTLGFVDSDGNPIDIATLKAGDTTADSWIASRGNDGTQLTGALLTSAVSESGATSTGAVNPDVRLTWSSNGINVFNQITARLYSRTSGSVLTELGIFLDKTQISAPAVQAASYTNGQITISGSFTISQVNYLANLLTSGALPLSLVTPPAYESSVTSTLGSKFTELSVIAGIITLILVMIFMIGYYRIPGVMAALALLFYTAVLMAIFKLFSVTLNLAGIGGFILSLGMAVDANIIIFERMKEEIRNGRTLAAAIEAGFDRAWLAIRDSNITTFISCIILYIIGGLVPSGASVRGFGIIVFIGVALSMFTCITVTRSLLRLWVGTETGKKTALFSVFTGRK